jgi:hypothetical protein
MYQKPKKAGSESGHMVHCYQVIVLVFVGCCLCMMASGSLGAKILGEVGDVGAAIGTLNQSYDMTGIGVGHPNDPHATDVATWAGSNFTDLQDFCDQSPTCGVRACQAPTPEVP